MDVMDFTPLVDEMNKTGVSYVIVGGIATVLHGYLRTTADIDFVVRLDRENCLLAVDVLERAGYRPRLPVAAKDFADPLKRQQWINEKGMMVFSFFHPTSALLNVDLFVHCPVDFEGLLARSLFKKMEETDFRVCSLKDLIEMKRLAGRPKDLDDLQKLEWCSHDGE